MDSTPSHDPAPPVSHCWREKQTAVCAKGLVQQRIQKHFFSSHKKQKYNLKTECRKVWFSLETEAFTPAANDWQAEGLTLERSPILTDSWVCRGHANTAAGRSARATTNETGPQEQRLESMSAWPQVRTWDGYRKDRPPPRRPVFFCSSCFKLLNKNTRTARWTCHSVQNVWSMRC